MNLYKERTETNKSIYNSNKLMLSNIHFFRRTINNKIKLNSNHNSDIEDIKKNKNYFKIDNKSKYNSHFDSQNNYSLPKIKINHNPLQISLEKETKLFKNLKSKSQRNILNFPNKENLKIVYKLKGKSTQNKFK